MQRIVFVGCLLLAAACGGSKEGSGGSDESAKESAWTSFDADLMAMMEERIKDPAKYANDLGKKQLSEKGTATVSMEDSGEFWIVQVGVLDGESADIEVGFSDGPGRSVDPKRIGPSTYVGMRPDAFDPSQLRRITDGYFKGWGMQIKMRPDGSVFRVRLEEPKGFDSTWSL